VRQGRAPKSAAVTNLAVSGKRLKENSPMKNYDLLDSLTKENVIQTVHRLGESKLTPTSHLHSLHGDKKIIEAAREYTKGYSDRARLRPALGLIEVVLAANRSYNLHVKPHIERIEKTTDLNTFDQLTDLIKELERDEFYKFWGHKNEKKFDVLNSILGTVTILRKRYPTSKDDFDLMTNWAKNVDLKNYESDIIGQIKNVAIATMQHLRMTFGHDTVKPDQRVKEVLEKEFSQPKLNNVDTVLAVEQIARISGLQTLELDQVFVNYGAGYYNRTEGKYVD